VEIRGCTVFVPGCNFRCPFCHNRDLVLRSSSLVPIPETDFFEFLESRRGKLEGVVVTGGEPLLQKDLGDFLQRVKGLGFTTKLDTNGSNSTALRRAVKRGAVDYIAFDVKAPFDERYTRAVGLVGDELGASDRFDPRVILRSVGIAAEFGVPFELRTTVVPTIHTLEDLTDLAQQLRDFFNSLNTKYLPRRRAGLILNTVLDTPPWYLQQFRPRNCLDPKFDEVEPHTAEFFKGAILKLRSIYPKVEVRI